MPHQSHIFNNVTLKTEVKFFVITNQKLVSFQTKGGQKKGKSCDQTISSQLFGGGLTEVQGEDYKPKLLEEFLLHAIWCLLPCMAWAVCSAKLRRWGSHEEDCWWWWALCLSLFSQSLRKWLYVLTKHVQSLAATEINRKSKENHTYWNNTVQQLAFLARHEWSEVCKQLGMHNEQHKEACLTWCVWMSCREGGEGGGEWVSECDMLGTDESPSQSIDNHSLQINHL